MLVINLSYYAQNILEYYNMHMYMYVPAAFCLLWLVVQSCLDLLLVQLLLLKLSSATESTFITMTFHDGLVCSNKRLNCHCHQHFFCSMCSSSDKTMQCYTRSDDYFREKLSTLFVFREELETSIMLGQDKQQLNWIPFMVKTTHGGRMITIS